MNKIMRRLEWKNKKNLKNNYLILTIEYQKFGSKTPVTA